MATTVSGIMISASNVHDALGNHMLVDGTHIVPDLERSHGSRLVDERDRRAYLDLFSNFASQPLGWNHPGLADPDFRERLLLAATHKPANSDVYTRFFAEAAEPMRRYFIASPVMTSRGRRSMKRGVKRSRETG